MILFISFIVTKFHVFSVQKMATLEKENTHLKIEKNKFTAALKDANKSASLNSNSVHEVLNDKEKRPPSISTQEWQI
ncbi:hypothetical protein L1887_05099 [Cichorium endivia]|nr:hypothetical protein L1887_05099 [Cichorium endivia]